MTKLALKINQNNFSDFVSKLSDLTSIEDVIKIKIDQENILMYSAASNESTVLALKSYLVPTTQYLNNFNRDETFDFIITGANKFVKNLRFFNTLGVIKLDITAKPLPEDDQIMHVRSAQFSDSKLKISCIGGEEHKIRDINKRFLENRLDPEKSKWSFNVSTSDFSDIKKLAQINNEDKIININVNDGVVSINEPAKWELHVDNIDYKNTQIIFGKKYLSNINQDGVSINFSIFETFILVKDEVSNLMISFEQDFSADDD